MSRNGKHALGDYIDSLPKINGDSSMGSPYGQLPDIPLGARAVGIVKKGSVIYELPPFTRYIVFHETEPPQIISMQGEMRPLDINNPTAVAK